MIREHQLATNETALNVVEFGDGPPLLLLHGVTRAWQDFDALIPSLARRCRVVAQILEDTENRVRLPAPYHVVDYARDALAVLREEIASPAVIIGHSLGAMAAAAAAAAAPDLVRGLILEDPPFETMGSRIGETALLGYFQQMQQLALAHRSVNELAAEMAEIRLQVPGAEKSERLGDLRDRDALQFSARCLAQADPEVLTPIVRGHWLLGFDRRAISQRIHCPVLVLQGNPALGGMLVDEDLRELQADLADCTQVAFANVGHHIHWQQTERTLQAVDAFVDSLEAPANDRSQIPQPHIRISTHEDLAAHDDRSQRPIG